MRAITWNIHSANKDSPIWELLLELKPDIILLQEVGGVPDKIKEEFDILSKVAINKTGRSQKFSTAVLVNGKIIREISLKSGHEQAVHELKFFRGNSIGCSIRLKNHEILKILSVHSPAWWPENSDLPATELIWSVLKNIISNNEKWILGGDFNYSETLRHYGKEWIEFYERMYSHGFKECLKEYNGHIVPTYKHTNKEIIHQLDHLFVTNSLYRRLMRCTVGDRFIIFGKSLSDHLPIIANFNDK